MDGTEDALSPGSRDEVMHPRSLAWVALGFSLSLASLPNCPSTLVDGERRLYEELDTTSPLDPFLLPVELLWARMPQQFRSEPLASLIEAGLVRILRGRAWFQVYWRPLRDVRLDVRPDGSAEVIPPVLRRTEVEALTGAALVAGTTVLERCIDLAEHVARGILGEAPRPVDPNRPIERIDTVRQLIGRLLADDSPLAHFVENIEPDADRRSVRTLAIQTAAQDLIDDHFPLIAKAYESAPGSEDVAQAIRHCIAHGRDLGDHLDEDRRLFSGFAWAMQTVFGRLQWLLLSMANVKSPLVAIESPHLGSCSRAGCCGPV